MDPRARAPTLQVSSVIGQLRSAARSASSDRRWRSDKGILGVVSTLNCIHPILPSPPFLQQVRPSVGHQRRHDSGQRAFCHHRDSRFTTLVIGDNMADVLKRACRPTSVRKAGIPILGLTTPSATEFDDQCRCKHFSYRTGSTRYFLKQRPAH